MKLTKDHTYSAISKIKKRVYLDRTKTTLKPLNHEDHLASTHAYLVKDLDVIEDKYAA